MKKFVCIFMVVLTVFMLGACSSGKTENKEITVDLAALKDSMISELQLTDAMEIPASALLNLYGIDAADIKSSACYTTNGGAFPHEVIMVEAASADAVAGIREKLENRLAQVLVQAQQYDAENYALAQQCKVTVKGNYVTLFISPEHAKLAEMFDAAAK